MIFNYAIEVNKTNCLTNVCLGVKILKNATYLQEILRFKGVTPKAIANDNIEETKK